MQAIVSWLLGNGYHSRNRLKTAQAKTSRGTFLIPALSGQQKALDILFVMAKKSYVQGYWTRDWERERKRRMVRSPHSKTDPCRTAFILCGEAGALRVGTKKFPFKILSLKTEKWFCYHRLQPGCLTWTVSQHTAWGSVPNMKTLSLSHISHGNQTLLSLQSVGLVWIAFFPVFEGFVTCLWSWK